MTCPVCPLKLTPEVFELIDQACPSCHRQIKQMRAGFFGVMAEHRPKELLWSNTQAYEDWQSKLTANDSVKVHLKDDENTVEQHCDIRDMKRVAGLPKFLPLEKQVFNAWILEGQKDERIQELLGLTYSQLFHVKGVVRIRLQKQMAYFHQIKKLAKENEVHDD